MLTKLISKIIFFQGILDIVLTKSRYSAATKTALKAFSMSLKSVSALEPINIQNINSGMRVFSQFDEDGVILALFSIIGMGKKRFVDIGSGNCIQSNCTNLAINFGWDGLYIDGNEDNVKRGINFFNLQPDVWYAPPKILHSFVTTRNVNHLLESNGYTGEIDFLSIDIDGDDYWIWKNIKAISPRAVMIETNKNFGLKNGLTALGKSVLYEQASWGASISSMKKMAEKKGYVLIATNKYGCNPLFVKKKLIGNKIKQMSLHDVGLLLNRLRPNKISLLQQVIAQFY